MGNETDEGIIYSVDVILISPNNKWSDFFSSFGMFSNDFMKEGREQPSKQDREDLQ